MQRMGGMVVAAAEWAERVRPRPYVAVLALSAVAALFHYYGQEVPVALRITFAALLTAFYVLPWLLSIGRGFAAGYRSGAVGGP